MMKMTLIAQVTDGLPLDEGLNDGRDLPYSDMYKQQSLCLRIFLELGIYRNYLTNKFNNNK